MDRRAGPGRYGTGSLRASYKRDIWALPESGTQAAQGRDGNRAAKFARRSQPPIRRRPWTAAAVRVERAVSRPTITRTKVTTSGSSM